MHLHNHWNKVISFKKPFILVNLNNDVTFCSCNGQLMTIKVIISYIRSITTTSATSGKNELWNQYMYVKRVLLHAPPRWVRFPRSGLIIMYILMPCTCISTTQAKTRVGWVSAFEHTSLVLVLGCRLIFGRPYKPEVGIGKKLINSLESFLCQAITGTRLVLLQVIQACHGQCIDQSMYHMQAYIYKTNTHKCCGGRILLSFEHCP